MPTILLASASPRRRQILEGLGHRVVVSPVDIDESERADEDPEAYLARVVDAKLEAARALFAGHPQPQSGATASAFPSGATASAFPSGAEASAFEDALMVADTTVVIDGRLLHKPSDDEDARRMLRALASQAHVVTTRFAIAAKSGDLHVESVCTRVVFRAIADDEVDVYVASGEGRDKAGGYAIQGRGGAFVSRIEGSHGAVVGLPPCEVSVALRRLGVQ
jgi:septum formation protein